MLTKKKEKKQINLDLVERKIFNAINAEEYDSLPRLFSLLGYKKGVKIDQRTAYGGHGNIQTLDSDDIKCSISIGDGYYNISVGGIGIFNTEDLSFAKIIE